MSYSATGPQSRDAGEARRQNALALIFLAAVIVAFAMRFFVPPEVMNSFMEYTTEYGSFYEKFHAGTYAILLLTPVALFSRPIYLEGDEIGRFKALMRFSLLMIVLIVFLIATGRPSAGGLFIDTYLIAGAGGLILLSMNRGMRHVAGDAVLLLNIASALIGTLEFATRTRFIKSALVEDTFRPMGLADHPLSLGMISAASIAFVALTRWKPWMKIAAMIVLLVGTAAAGARFALVLALLEVVMLILFVRWEGLAPRTERRAKTAVLLMVLVGGAGLLAILAAGGALSRFESGIVDQNFFARTDIYQIFGMVNWQDLVFGADLEEIMKIVTGKLNLPYIESSPVYFTFLLGAPLALATFWLIFWVFWRMLRFTARPAWIGTAVFFAAALSNNTLSSKTPVVAMFMVLVVAYAGTRKADPARTATSA